MKPKLLPVTRKFRFGRTSNFTLANIITKRYDGMVYGKIDPALHDHKNARLAHYFKNPFVVGGTENTKTEVYDFNYETWVELPSFPFATFIHSYG